MPSNSTKVEEGEVCGEAKELHDSGEISVWESGDNPSHDGGKLAVIQSMIKQVRNGTPIYRVQLPIFLQEPRSLLERYGDFCSHVDFINRYAKFL